MTGVRGQQLLQQLPTQVLIAARIAHSKTSQRRCRCRPLTRRPEAGRGLFCQPVQLVRERRFERLEEPPFSPSEPASWALPASLAPGGWTGRASQIASFTEASLLGQRAEPAPGIQLGPDLVDLAGRQLPTHRLAAGPAPRPHRPAARDRDAPPARTHSSPCRSDGNEHAHRPAPEVTDLPELRQNSATPRFQLLQRPVHGPHRPPSPDLYAYHAVRLGTEIPKPGEPERSPHSCVAHPAGGERRALHSAFGGDGPGGGILRRARPFVVAQAVMSSAHQTLPMRSSIPAGKCRAVGK